MLSFDLASTLANTLMAATEQTRNARRKRRPPEVIMQRLVSAAAQEFSHSGYRGATTATIAARAEVTEAQLFRYFDSKADLFRAAVAEPLNAAFAAFNARQLQTIPSPQERHEATDRYIADLRQFITEHRKMLLCMLLAEAYSPDGIRGVGGLDALGEYFRLGADVMAGHVDANPRVAPELMVRVSFAAVLANELFRDWLFPRGMASAGDVDAAITRFVREGLSANDATQNSKAGQRRKP